MRWCAWSARWPTRSTDRASPPRYAVAAARQHRWARGDWQLLPWMLGLVRAGAARDRADYLTAIGFWKMFDNLRRTLSAPAVLISLLAGWLLPFPAALAWTIFLVLSVAMPTILPIFRAVLPRHGAITLRS